MKKIEYVIQKYVDSWSDFIVYSEDESRHASINFKRDIEIVLAAVSQSGTTLKYACNELKENEEIVLWRMKIQPSLS